MAFIQSFFYVEPWKCVINIHCYWNICLFQFFLFKRHVLAVLHFNANLRRELMNNVKRLFFQNLKMEKLLLEMWGSSPILVSIIFFKIQNNHHQKLILCLTNIKSYIFFRVRWRNISNLFGFKQGRPETSKLENKRNDPSPNELNVGQTMCRRSTPEKKREKSYGSEGCPPYIYRYWSIGIIAIFPESLMIIIKLIIFYFLVPWASEEATSGKQQPRVPLCRFCKHPMKGHKNVVDCPKNQGSSWHM